MSDRYEWQARVKALWLGWHRVTGEAVLPDAALRMVVGVSAGGGKTHMAGLIDARADDAGVLAARLLSADRTLDLPHFPREPAVVICDASGGRPDDELRIVRAAVEMWPTTPLLVLTFPQHVDGILDVLKAPLPDLIGEVHRSLGRFDRQSEIKAALRRRLTRQAQQLGCLMGTDHE